MDGEVSNSTYADQFAREHPERYFEMFIAEQQLVAAAVGFSARGYTPFASTFAAFLTRAYDFIRMAAISQANIRLSGSHAGVEIGADGPSQMALEDLAMMRAVHGSTVLYPSDATSAVALVAAMADLDGVVYLRTTRGAYPVLYGPDEAFPVGGAKVLRSDEADQVTLVGAGVTLHDCLAAADQLSADGISARVIDLYSVKPADAGTLTAAAAATGGRIVIAEDHHPEGGLGSAVLDALTGAGRAELSIAHLAVRDCRDRGPARNCSTPPASTPPTSPRPRGCSSGSRLGRRPAGYRSSVRTPQMHIIRAVLPALALTAGLASAGCGSGGPATDGPLRDVPDGGAECQVTHVGQIVTFGLETFTNYGQTTLVLDGASLLHSRGLRVVGSAAMPGEQELGEMFGWPPKHRDMPPGWKHRRVVHGFRPGTGQVVRHRDRGGRDRRPAGAGAGHGDPLPRLGRQVRGLRPLREDHRRERSPV